MGTRVHLGQHSDAELVKLAKAGWSPAFAVLVHRYAPLVHAALADRSDPLSATTSVFVHAMRELRQRAPEAPIAPWLLELIDRPPPARPSELTDEELDAVWHELHRRWPDGDRPATTWPWRRLALVAGVIVVAAGVPALVLGVDTPQEEADVELRAVPVTDEPLPVDAPDDDSLPSFSFPVAPEDGDAPAPEAEQAEPEPTPEPEAPPAETAPAEPAPEPTPAPAQPAPAPAPEPEPSTEEEPEDDGVLDPVLGGGGSDDGTDGGGDADGAGDDESAGGAE
jgi:hypothetical protein